MSSDADPHDTDVAEDVDRLLDLAAAHRDQHQYAEARVLYERVLAQDERQPVLTMLGAIQQELGDSGAAIATLRRSLTLAPDDDEAHFHLGLALRSTDAGAAFEHFRRAVAIDPRPPAYHREAAIVLWRLKRFDEALTAAEQALARDADDAFARHTLGLVLEQRGELDAAVEAHLGAARSDPACGLFWASAARVTARAGRHDDAERLFREGLAAEVDSALVCRHYGRFLRDRGRLSTARRYLQRAVDLDPDDERARRDLAALDGEV